MTGIKRPASLTAIVLAASLGAGCGDAATPTSPTTTPASPATSTFTTTFPPLGAVARAFTASQAGTVTVTLVNAAPPENVALGLGIGIPRADGGGCTLASSLITPAGSAAQITTTVDAGNYCVRVFDPGTLTDPVGVTVTIVHP